MGGSATFIFPPFDLTRMQEEVESRGGDDANCQLSEASPAKMFSHFSEFGPSSAIKPGGIIAMHAGFTGSTQVSVMKIPNERLASGG